MDLLDVAVANTFLFLLVATLERDARSVQAELGGDRGDSIVLQRLRTEGGGLVLTITEGLMAMSIALEVMNPKQHTWYETEGW